MAILIEEKQKFNWKALAIFIVIIAAVSGGAYALFFTDVPAIDEAVNSPASKSVSELANVKFDPDVVMNSDKRRALRPMAGKIILPQMGRVNPFVKY
mgnify:CR=1 FL=1